MTIRTREQTESSSRRGLDFYQERIKPTLTDVHNGRYIAIDANTGEFEIGGSEWEVVGSLKARVAGAEVLVVIHPRIWVHAI